jgi:hypothetical protein
MAQKFCSRITRKLRRMGLGLKVARFFAGFFYVSMIFVCGLFGVTPCLTGRGWTGEENECSLRPLQDSMAGVSYYPENGAGIRFADARPVPVMSASFGIRRR